MTHLRTTTQIQTSLYCRERDSSIPNPRLRTLSQSKLPHSSAVSRDQLNLQFTGKPPPARTIRALETTDISALQLSSSSQRDHTTIATLSHTHIRASLYYQHHTPTHDQITIAVYTHRRIQTSLYSSHRTTTHDHITITLRSQITSPQRTEIPHPPHTN